MGKEFFDILIFGRKTYRTRHLRIYKKTLKAGLQLSAVILLLTVAFLCDYIQVKKKAYELTRLKMEKQTQNSQIHFFSARMEDLERQLSGLKDFDRKIRIIANLEKPKGTDSPIGIGGPSPSDIREKLIEGEDTDGLVRQMRSDMDRLFSEAFSREESLAELEKLLKAKKTMLAHTPSIWPVQGWVTSGFGFRTHPITGLRHKHEGIDVSNRLGTPVIAPANGVVSTIGNDPGFGRVLVLSHGFGMTTRYAHLNKILVKVGQRVKRGEKIAEIGKTGMVTGPHLHYEVWLNGVPVNPRRYILN